MSEERASASEGRFCEVESESFDEKAAAAREKAAPSETPNGCGGLEDVRASLSDSQDDSVEVNNPGVVEGQSTKPQEEIGETGEFPALDKGRLSPACDKPVPTPKLKLGEDQEIVPADSDSCSIAIEHLVSGDPEVGAHIKKSKDGTLEDWIQISQWSLSHRIKVCAACMEYNGSERRTMTPLCSIEYAKQSLALVDVVYNTSFAPLEWNSDDSWESQIETLHKTLKSSEYTAWEALTTVLTAKLSVVRENDKKLHVFDGKRFEPWEIYKAVEEEELQSFKDMMLEIGWEHWGLIKPEEYKGATPLHWAVLHGQEEMVSFMKEKILSNRKPAGAKLSQELNSVNSCDEFGFTPLHMASFSCLIARGLSDKDARRCSRLAATLFDMGGRSCGTSHGSHLNFLVFAEAPVSSGAFFVARHYLSSFNHPIHPIQLAVWFAHPCLVKKLMSILMKEAFEVTDDGDTIFHLAAWGVNKQHGKVMTLLLRYLHLSPAALNFCNREKQTPLHIAVFQGKYECVAALVRCHYTRFSTKNMREYKPRDIAQILRDSCTPTKLARDVFAWSLGRKDSDSTKFGFSTLKVEYNEAHDMQSEADSLKAVMTRIFNLIDDHESLGLEGRILRHRKILQISQWSKRHRILALWMFDEDVELELKTGVYKDQYWKLSETLCQGMDGFEQVRPLSATLELKRLTDEFSKPCSDAVHKKLQPIYCAVEEGDLDEFKKKLSKLKKEHWWKGLKQYRGATLLHWAAFHGEKEMVSLIRKGIVPSDGTSLIMSVNESDEGPLIWSRIKDARDMYGFTPLHLAVLSLYSPWLKKYHTQKEEDAAKNCAGLIEELYQISVPNCSNTISSSNFIGWNLWDYRYADDHDLSHIEIYPIHLGVWFAHPRVVTKLVQRWPGDEVFVKTSKGDTILHCVTWNDSMTPKQLIPLLSTSTVNLYCQPLLSTSDNIRNSSNELKRETQLQNFVNASNEKRETPLHNAVHIKSLAWVDFLLGFDRINVNLRNQDGYTPRELAVVRLLEDSTQAGKDDGQCFQKLFPSCLSDGTSKSKAEDPLEKIIYSIDCKDPAGLYRETEALQKERQVYVDAANAILVGAALIASASFGAWLQPPLGYKEYYSSDFLLQDVTAPANTYEAFVAIKQYWIIHLFWVFNSLSFFFSLATVIAGANAALPQQGLNVKEAVISVRGAVKWASWLLALAIVFVVGTFTTLGFAILPHIEKYRINMYCTVFVGLLVCVSCLAQLLQKISPNAGSTKSTSRIRWSKQLKCHSKPSKISRGLTMAVDKVIKHRTKLIEADT